MNKINLPRWGQIAIGLAVVSLLFTAGVGVIEGARGVSSPTVSSAPQSAPAQPVVAPSAPTAPVETPTGYVFTQTFTLRAGWNSIYLEVEPINTSPLTNTGTLTQPIWTPTQSTLEQVFSSLNCADCLDGVWTWHVPRSRMDYIIDPAEELWDQPGWERYFPEASLGPDGQSRSFLTTLLNLHANTAYLVKLKAGASPVTLQVAGEAIVGHRRWAKASYNLVGFPSLAAGGPTVAQLQSTSAITDVRSLNSDGRWSASLAPTEKLQAGEAYLAYYTDQGTAPDEYTAPLNVKEVMQEGLTFSRRTGAPQQSLLVENLSSVPATVTLALVNAPNAAVRLRYSTTSTQTVDLNAGPISLALSPGGAQRPEFTVQAREQTGRGVALLQISSAELGTRWLVPVAAEAGSLAGLWVGDIVVNDVSEGRLGGTNVANGALTIALLPRDASGLRGAVGMQEIVAGNSSSVAVTLTLGLSTTASTSALPVITGTAPYVGGYVFVDANQNGQRDPDETGLTNVVVSASPGRTTMTRTTDSNGAYLFQGLSQTWLTNTLTLAVPAPPNGYTRNFTVTRPATQTLPLTATLPTVLNAWPVTVTVNAQGITNFGSAAYRQQVLPPPYQVPYYDATGNRVEPNLDFGYVPVYDASVWSGTCSARVTRLTNLGQVVNASLNTQVVTASLNPQPGSNTLLLGGGTTYVVYVEQAGANGAAGQGVACGEIAVGAPTQSEFRYRVLLRVAADGSTGLLPRYVVDPPTNTLRISSAAFSQQTPITASGRFSDTSPSLGFNITIGSDDPRNPFKHKYAPDHDNLDAKFNPIDLGVVPPYLWESYQVTRRLTLELTQYPPNGSEADAQALDWGGTTWGGNYREVLSGLHQNDITVKGYFIIRQVLTADQLRPQTYDR